MRNKTRKMLGAGLLLIMALTASITPAKGQVQTDPLVILCNFMPPPDHGSLVDEPKLKAQIWGKDLLQNEIATGWYGDAGILRGLAVCGNLANLDLLAIWCPGPLPGLNLVSTVLLVEPDDGCPPYILFSNSTADSQGSGKVDDISVSTWWNGGQFTATAYVDRPAPFLDEDYAVTATPVWSIMPLSQARIASAALGYTFTNNPYGDE